MFFHGFTGCVSAFFGKGKKSAWETWQKLPEVTFAFQLLSGSPLDEPIVQENIKNLIDMFVCILYNFNLSEVDQARLEGFYYKGLDFDHLPPSSVALQQHVLRAIYQSGYVWGKCLQSNPEAPGPTN